MEDMELKPKQARGILSLSREGLGPHGIGRVDEERHGGGAGYQFVQQLQLLRRHLHVQRGHAGNIAARSPRLATNPSWTGSSAIWNTIGIVAVAALAASAAGRPVSAITLTCRRTRSAASAGNRSYCPSAKRYSIARFRPSL